MLNNKGQSLVLFILIIPILLGIMALVVDAGNVVNKKNEMENTIELVIDYGLEDKYQKEELKLLLNYNLKDCNNTLDIIDEKIIVTSTTYVEGIFSNILGFKGFFIESNYEGYLIDEKKEIKKIK